MAKKENIVRYTSEGLKAMIARGKDRSDMAKANREMTEEEIVADILTEGVEDLNEWNSGQIWKGLPPLDIFKPKPPKASLTIRLDRDVLDWFKARGKGYQTMLNEVLRSFVRAQPQTPKKAKRAVTSRAQSRRRAPTRRLKG